MRFEQLIQDYGYYAVVVVTFFEGETIAILAGVAAQYGLLELPWVIAAALAGSFSGDQLWYWMGRRWGPRLLAWRASWRVRAERVYKHLRRHQDWIMLTFRFYYGLRSVTPFAIGAAQMSRWRFIVLNLAGAAIWAISFVCAGYLLGEASAGFFETCRRYGYYFFAALVAVGVTFWLVARMRRRRRAILVVENARRD